MSVTVTPAALRESLPLEHAGTHRRSSCFARFRTTTEATVMRLRAFNDLRDQIANLTEIAVWLDGVYTFVHQPPVQGSSSWTLALPRGAKAVEVVAGPQSKPGATVLGTFIEDLTFSRPAPQDLTTATGRVYVYGDSITAGDGAEPGPHRDAFVPRLRGSTAADVLADAWGWRSLHDDCADAPARSAFAARVAGWSPTRIVLFIGTNDYGLARWSAADFGTAYAATLDALRTALPQVDIDCLSPIPRAAEAANAFGDTTGAYRAAIAGACASRPWATYHDGTTVVSASNLADGVHPNDAGHGEISAYLASIL